MERNRLIALTIICAMIALFGIVSYQWLLGVCIIAVFLLILAAWYVIETLSAIRQSVEKIERQLEEMQKSGQR
jgi:Na+-transporting methylmalonyl-CoA/oxaloacetate decarboxylase gamma subunit